MLPTTNRMKGLMALLSAALMGGVVPSPRIGRSGLIRAAWHDPRRVEQAEDKRQRRAVKVNSDLAAGGYRSGRWNHG